MSNRVAQTILLVEDLNHDNFLRSFLYRCGHEKRSIRTRLSSTGRGSGEQFVREHYAIEVRAIRHQLTRTKACLIVMIDADTQSIENRFDQLDRALKDADQDPRQTSEPIMNLAPKRSVETWVLGLSGIEMDEETDVRRDKRVNSQSIKGAAQTLFDWSRTNYAIPRSCVPSLKACIPELARISTV